MKRRLERGAREQTQAEQEKDAAVPHTPRLNVELLFLFFCGTIVRRMNRYPKRSRRSISVPSGKPSVLNGVIQSETKQKATSLRNKRRKLNQVASSTSSSSLLQSSSMKIPNRDMCSTTDRNGNSNRRKATSSSSFSSCSATASSSMPPAVSASSIRFSQKGLLRYCMRRQGLLKRLPLSTDTLSEIGPLHSTAQTTPVLSLLARIDDISHSSVLPLLSSPDHTIRQYDRLRCMRSTVHMIPLAATACVTAVFAEDHYSRLRHSLRDKSAINDKSVVDTAETIVRLLRERGEMSSRQLKKALLDEKETVSSVKVKEVMFFFVHMDSAFWV